VPNAKGSPRARRRDPAGRILADVTREKLWNYGRLCAVWAWTLVACAPAVLVVGALLEMGDPKDGLEGSWIPIALAAFVSSLVIFFFLLRMWMRPTAVPTGRLSDARRDNGKPRLTEAGPGDWRVWGGILAACLFVACVMMMTFLVGILGSGGMAEGVVGGVLLAWGLVTLEDLRGLRRIEAEEGRTYFAACRRPVSVGTVLVWRPTAG